MTDPAWILYDKPRAEAEARKLGKNPLTLPALPKTKARVVLVAGPPGGGKTTYVNDRKAENDIVIDLDEIKSELSGKPVHQTPDDPELLKRALRERNRRLEDLSDASSGVTAWIVAGAPRAADREHWQQTLDAEVVVLEEPLDEVQRRIMADDSRAGREEEMIAWAQRWWSDYEEVPKDE